MIRIRRILCPTDFSECSRRALHQAIPVARYYQADLTALHVIAPVAGPTYVDYVNPSLLDPRSREHALEALAEFVAPARAAAVRADTIVREGGPAQEILAAAEALPADLIVMGTHGRTGFSRLMLGSVTEKVLRNARCPVLTASREDRAFSGPAPFKRILCATDFSPAAQSALEHALSLVQQAQGTLIVMHVVEDVPERELQRHAPELPAFWKGEADDAWRRVRRAIPASARGGCQIEEIVRFGKPPEEILRVAEAREAQLIVLGMHGRSALDRMMFGSSAQRVVREAPCPVLTIRPPALLRRARAAGAHA
jgi:nucleotide-binding universal stress UspA family protein